MKYIIKNLKNFISKELGIFVLALTGIIVSTLIIHFSYGIFQHYNILSKEPNMEDCMTLHFYKNDGKYVSKGMLNECIYDVIDGLDIIEGSGNKIMVCTAFVQMDGDEYQLKFCFDREGFHAPIQFLDNIKTYGAMGQGSGWTEVEEQSEKKVALCYNYLKYTGDTPVLKKIMQDDGTLLIGGKNYTIIGYQSWTNDGALIPYSTVDDEVLVKELVFSCSENLTRKTYDYISEVFMQRLGKLVMIEEKPEIDLDTYYTYRSIVLLVSVLALMAVTNYCILYCYILEKRKKKAAIFRCCGLSKRTADLMNLAECYIISMPVYLCSVLVYEYWILPILQKWFMYIRFAHTIETYFVIFMVFFIVTGMVCWTFIKAKNKSVLDGLR